jgi:predicted dehydrogenase
MKRRNFISHAVAGAAATTLFPGVILGAGKPRKKLRLCMLGVGSRGSYLMSEALSQGAVELSVVCDIDNEMISRARKMWQTHQAKEPVIYTGEEDFRKAVRRDDVDVVIIATPWKWHAPMAIASMEAGKYTGCEVVAALTVEECWDLVNTQEKTGAHFMMLENVCYRQDIMAVTNMVRQGVFGKLLYTECGYQHDLRDYLFNDGKSFHGEGAEFGKKAVSEARWRTQHYVDRNGELYPTHGLGPIAKMLDINRGNQMSYITAMASPSAGLHNYIVDKGGPNHPNAKVSFKQGDVVTSMIKCANGEVIKITHDTSSPRPYSLGFRVQGTKGIWTEEAQGIHIEKKSPPHQYEPASKYFQEYDHPLWKEQATNAANSGHGGMDYFLIQAFLEAARTNSNPPQDVYDAAMWSVISPLSEQSIAEGSTPVQIPDFTRGKWRDRRPVY